CTRQKYPSRKVAFINARTMKTNSKRSYQEQPVINTYGPALRVVTGRQNRKWAQTRSYNHYQSRLPNGLLSLANKCILVVPFPVRRLLTKTCRVSFLQHSLQ